ncbi:hypothetical protein ACFY4B_18125 [Kitasatospora sp. NPDC001261]|uniref:hypothetical protein n=1 Tax=Kitasatospora sp. NPDC001261 TaxID=3364012 RepID=UPI0036B47EC4
MQVTGFMRRRAGVVVAAIAAATIAGTVPANAEGSWSSSITNWMYNFESRLVDRQPHQRELDHRQLQLLLPQQVSPGTAQSHRPRDGQASTLES